MDAISHLLCTDLARAYDAPNLTGSTVKTEDVTTHSDAIFVGEIIDMSDPVPTSPGTASCVATVKIAEVLKGSAVGNELVDLESFAIDREGLPKVKIAYTFFVRINEDSVERFTAIKLLPSDEGRIATIKNLIDHAPNH